MPTPPSDAFLSRHTHAERYSTVGSNFFRGAAFECIFASRPELARASVVAAGPLNTFKSFVRLLLRVFRRVMFADAPTGETFRVSLGIGPVAALARYQSIPPSPENWTLGQRRRLMKSAIRERSTLVPVEEEGDDGSSRRGNAGTKAHSRATGRSLCYVVRCRTASAPAVFHRSVGSLTL